MMLRHKRFPTFLNGPTGLAGVPNIQSDLKSERAAKNCRHACIMQKRRIRNEINHTYIRYIKVYIHIKRLRLALAHISPSHTPPRASQRNSSYSLEIRGVHPWIRIRARLMMSQTRVGTSSGTAQQREQPVRAVPHILTHAVRVDALQTFRKVPPSWPPRAPRPRSAPRAPAPWKRILQQVVHLNGKLRAWRPSRDELIAKRQPGTEISLRT